MAKPKSDNRDIFDKALEERDTGRAVNALVGGASFGLLGRGLGKLGRRSWGWKKPTRAEAKKDEFARWDRREADKFDNMLTAYGVAKGSLIGALGGDPRYSKRRKKK